MSGGELKTPMDGVVELLGISESIRDCERSPGKVGVKWMLAGGLKLSSSSSWLLSKFFSVVASVVFFSSLIAASYS